MGVSWGVPVQRKKKVEQFSTPVVTLAALAGKGSGRKIMFNKAAQEALGLISPEDDSASYVSVGKITETGQIAIMASLKEVEGIKSFKINKSFAFSDAKTFDFVTRTLGLSNTSPNHLHIEEVEGERYYKVASHEAEGELSTTDAATPPSEEEGKENSVVEDDTNPIEAEGTGDEVFSSPGEEAPETPEESAAVPELEKGSDAGTPEGDDW